MSNIMVIRLCLFAATRAPRTSWISKNHLNVFWKRKFATKWNTTLVFRL